MAVVSDADLDGLVGAFYRPDRDMFRVLLEATHEIGGELAELGVLLGQSAVLVGDYLAEGEIFTVIDLFESAAPDSANESENSDSNPGLTRKAFEDNYLRLHPELPVVIQGLSGTIVEHAKHAGHRFVHVDASHLFEHVVEDIVAARILLKPD